MIAVITGDIINSRKVAVEEWQPKLRRFLQNRIKDSSKWEIYRGDSFQIQVNIEEVLEIVLLIKALIKTNSIIDVRISIGIGKGDFFANRVTESYGEAFIFSGESFETLKDKTLTLKTTSSSFDEIFIPVFSLVSFIANQWKPVTAEIFFTALSNKELLQKEIAQLLKRDSTTVSRALKRAAYYEILSIIKLFNQKAILCFN